MLFNARAWGKEGVASRATRTRRRVDFAGPELLPIPHAFRQACGHRDFQHDLADRDGGTAGHNGGNVHIPREIDRVSTHFQCDSPLSFRSRAVFIEKDVPRCPEQIFVDISGGSITIDLQGAGVLGNEVDVLDQMVGNSGTVDITRTSINTLNQYGVGNSVVLSLPFVFVSRDHYWKWVDSESGQAYLAELHDAGKGLRAICYGEEGFRSFFTSESKPITTPDDMKGMKIRSSSDPIMVGMIEALGATSSPVAYNEVYTSIQNGTIDGAENPVNNYYSNAFYEVAKNLTLDEHTLGATQIVMTDASYDSLTPAQQEAINEAGKIAEQYCREISEQGEKDTFEKLKEAGVNIIPVDDKTPWQEKVQPLIDAQLSTDDLKAFYQTIVDMAE